MSKRLLFLGSDRISEICLRSLTSSYPSFHFEVITTSAASPPALLASQLGLALYHDHKGPMKNWKLMSPDSPIWSSRYDFIISASFGYLIPSKLIQHSDHSLNMHPSLLPRYRGSSPIQHALYNRDQYTGVSIITLDPTRFDKGIILKQEVFQESIEYDTYFTLSTKLAGLGGTLLGDVLDDYKQHELKAIVQDESQVTLAPKFNAEFARLNIEKTEELNARFRCLFGTSLNPHFMFEGKRVNIYDMRKVTSKEEGILRERFPSAVPGSLWLIYPGIGRTQTSTKFLKNIDKVIFMKTGDGWIAIQDFLLAGRQHTKHSVGEFINIYFRIEDYTQMEDLSKETGELLKFQ